MKKKNGGSELHTIPPPLDSGQTCYMNVVPPIFIVTVHHYTELYRS